MKASYSAGVPHELVSREEATTIVRELAPDYNRPASRLYTGIIYESPPEEGIGTDIGRNELQQLVDQGKFERLGIYFSHNNKSKRNRGGSIVKASMRPESGTVEVDFRLELDTAAGREIQSFIDKHGLKTQLSLCHCRHPDDGSAIPLEVSVCPQGARSGTMLVKASRDAIVRGSVSDDFAIDADAPAPQQPAASGDADDTKMPEAATPNPIAANTALPLPVQSSDPAPPRSTDATPSAPTLAVPSAMPPAAPGTTIDATATAAIAVRGAETGVVSVHDQEYLGRAAAFYHHLHAAQTRGAARGTDPRSTDGTASMYGTGIAFGTQEDGSTVPVASGITATMSAPPTPTPPQQGTASQVPPTPAAKSKDRDAPLADGEQEPKRRLVDPTALTAPDASVPVPQSTGASVQGQALLEQLINVLQKAPASAPVAAPAPQASSAAQPRDELGRFMSPRDAQATAMETDSTGAEGHPESSVVVDGRAEAEQRLRESEARRNELEARIRLFEEKDRQEAAAKHAAAVQTATANAQQFAALARERLGDNPLAQAIVDQLTSERFVQSPDGMSILCSASTTGALSGLIKQAQPTSVTAQPRPQTPRALPMMSQTPVGRGGDVSGNAMSFVQPQSYDRGMVVSASNGGVRPLSQQPPLRTAPDVADAYLRGAAEHLASAMVHRARSLGMRIDLVHHAAPPRQEQGVLFVRASARERDATAPNPFVGDVMNRMRDMVDDIDRTSAGSGMRIYAHVAPDGRRVPGYAAQPTYWQ